MDREEQHEANPWLRYVARNIDTALYMLVIMLLFFIAGVISEILGIDTSLIEKVPDDLFFVLSVMVLILIESIVLYFFETTPAKNFLKIKIEKSDNTVITYGDAIERTVRVWVFGMAFGISYISAIAQLIAFRILADNGITSWDKKCNFSIVHEKLKAWRIVVAVVVNIFIFYVYGMLLLQ